MIEVLGIANSVGIERYGIAAQPPMESVDLSPSPAAKKTVNENGK